MYDILHNLPLSAIIISCMGVLPRYDILLDFFDPMDYNLIGPKIFPKLHPEISELVKMEVHDG